MCKSWQAQRWLGGTSGASPPGKRLGAKASCHDLSAAAGEIS